LLGDRQDLALLDDQRSDQVFERGPLAKAVLIKKQVDQRPQQLECLAGLILDRREGRAGVVIGGLGRERAGLRTARPKPAGLPWLARRKARAKESL
jgi:hypothetical protein